MQIRNSTGTYDFTYVYQEGQLISRLNPDGTKYFYQDDHLGSTSVITNSTGNVIENTYYSPYGEELSGGNLDVKGYTGQFDDEATGQMYYGARYYVPTHGQFISWDPMIQNVYDAQLLNHYSYSRNNPYNLKDPDGKEVVVAIKHTGIPIVGDTGHIAFVVRNPDAKAQSESYTFYSNQGPKTQDSMSLSYIAKSFIGSYESGYVNPSSSTAEGALPDNYYDSFLIQTTPGQERQIIAEAEEIIDNPQTYYAAWRNSQDFVIQSLDAGDIDLDRKLFPKNTFNINKDVYAAQNQEYFLTPYERINRLSSGSGGSGGGRASQVEALKRFWDKKKTGG